MPSAYLLFYMRDDIARGRHRVEDIFKYDIPDETMEDSGAENATDSNQPKRGRPKHTDVDDASTRRRSVDE